jgi:hypothetical protein
VSDEVIGRLCDALRRVGLAAHAEAIVRGQSRVCALYEAGAAADVMGEVERHIWRACCCAAYGLETGYADAAEHATKHLDAFERWVGYQERWAG